MRTCRQTFLHSILILSFHLYISSTKAIASIHLSSQSSSHSSLNLSSTSTTPARTPTSFPPPPPPEKPKQSKYKRIKQIMGQSISLTQWYVYGRRHFTQTAYQRHLKDYYPTIGEGVQSNACVGRNEDCSDGMDLDGKVVVVTGANSGIGKELATYAAAKGAKLYMLCRTMERAEKAKEEIIQSTKNDNINIIQVDTGELAQIHNAAEELQKQENQIHCLICNAGALFNDKRLTSEGHEVSIASHLLGGSYLLSKLLLPNLQNAVKAEKEEGKEEQFIPRVIYVSSGGMYNTKFPAWDVASNQAKDQKYDGVMAYAYAKRGQVILADEFAKKHPSIQWLSCHPGWVDTAAVDDAFDSKTKAALSPLRTKWEGAEGIAWLMGTKSKLENGGFYLDRKAQPKHIAGPFMTEGSFTKNSNAEIEEFMEKLHQVVGV